MLTKNLAFIVLSFATMACATLAFATTNNEYQTATIHGVSFYPSEFIPDIDVYARDTETGSTFKLSVPAGTDEYKMELPAPATYIFFSWTNSKELDSQIGAVFSKCDGSSADVCDDNINHLPRPIQLSPGAVIEDFKIANYYYPSKYTYYFVPKP